MKPILVLSILVAVAYGRPEPPSGYNYPSPSSRYGAPSGGQDQGRSRSNGQSGTGFGGGSGFGSGFGSGSAGSFAGSFASGSTSASSGQSSSGAGRSASSGGTSSDSITINKHIYVHVPPPELEDEPQQKARVNVPPPQKNYKIIFIKAPNTATASVPKIPPIPQNEEKTLVYVLVKKPEEQTEIEIPTAAPTEPSRPEVYFIKYKTQKESNGQQGAAEGDDDTVEVGAREGAGQAGGQQGGASSGGYSYSSSRSTSSNEVSRQYGAPNSSGPY